MSEELEVEKPKLKCYCCKAEYNETDSFCGSCGYPFNASEEEQKQFSIKYTVTKFGKDGVENKIKEARIILYVIASFTVLQGIILYASNENMVALIINLAIAALFACFGFWSKKNPFAATFSGVLVYMAMIILMTIIDPLSIAKGIIMKVLFSAALIRAAYGAYKYKIAENE